MNVVTMKVKNSKILVIGSSNTDMVVRVKTFPSPGETVLSDKFLMNPGGKGANQAVAAARLGASVTFITKIGDDIFGKQSFRHLAEEGICTDYILSDGNNPSGIALITVDHRGENTIVVAPGANSMLSVPDIQNAAKAFEESSLLLMQLEIPMEIAGYGIEMARKCKMDVILNPAPAMPLPDALLRGLLMITPNESEAEIITGRKITDISSMKIAADELMMRGVKNVVITLGDKGAYVRNENISMLIPPIKVNAVDTTAAGDVFNAALAVAIAEERTLLEAVHFANRAAAISVTKMGAQTAAPFRADVEEA